MSGTIAGPGWRADVRERVATILVARVPAVGARVYRARVWPVGGDKKPALLVYGYAERKERVGNAGTYQHQFRVTCSMVVRVLCEGTSGAEDVKAAEAECEAIAASVERAILRAPELWSPGAGVLENCAGVTTQISADQKERGVEVEATMEFQLAWSEIFEMAEPDTSECETVSFTNRDPAIPLP